MKYQFINASRRHGTSSKNGNPYDICTISVGIPIQAKTTENYDFRGFGVNVLELPLSPDALPQFSDIPLGASIELELQPDLINPRRTIVTGVTPSK
jgi:hypothetical protein